ncbi:MAG: hypothetical protein L6420_11505 [Elusimicrobia bacterium]|nr:hypothetical protein [Elusimicrobiota bacterium]
MKASKNNDSKKGGFLAALSKFFGSSPASSGGASSGIGTAVSGFGGGLFASKAGIVGMVLGGATIAAGVGVVYNFIGPSSKPAHSPSLFENQYYEAEAENAGAKRMADYNSSDAADSSSLDYFRNEAKKDGIEFGDGDYEDGDGGKASADGDDLYSSSAGGEAGEGGNGYGANASAFNAPKLQKAPSFDSSGGGSQSKLNLGGAGMSGGIGSKFHETYKPPAGQGKSSSMKNALAAKINKSAKYNLPGFNRKGAYGQSKATKRISADAARKYGAGSKSAATEAFSGETDGKGDVGAPVGGVGLGGAGLSGGSKLKGSDPSLSSNKSTPPPAPPEPEDVSPWKKYENMAMYGMLASAALILTTKMLAHFAKANPLYYQIATLTAYAAIAAAAMVIFAGMMMMSKYGQKWMGAMYLMAGATLMWQAIQALSGVGEKAVEYNKANAADAKKTGLDKHIVDGKKFSYREVKPLSTK